MLSIETEARVAKILLTLAEGEKSIEISRQLLSDNFDFDSYQIFKALDTSGKNNIDSCDIINFLQTRGIYANPLEVNLLILNYDEDSNGSLSYPEFLYLIQSEKSKKNRNSYPNDELSFDIEYSLGKLIQREINLSRKIIPLLQDLKCRYDFNIHDIYHQIKTMNYITPDDIQNFLEKNHAGYLEMDINNIIKRLDFNKDGRVDLCEFHKFFGFPECSNFCPTKKCNICGCSSCNYCDSCYSSHCYNSNICCPPILRCSPIEDNNNINLQNNMYNNLVGKNNMKGNSNLIDSQNSTFLYTVDNNNHNENKNINSQGNRSLQNSIQQKPILEEKNPQINQTIQNNNIPQENSNNSFKNNNNNSEKISSNLSLRLSPERKIIPQNYSLLNDQVNTSDLTLSTLKNKIKEDKTDNNVQNKNNNNNNTNNNNLQENNSNQLEQIQLNDFLKELMELENKIEKLKINLASKSDFNVEDAFRFFESYGKGYLTKEDLKYGLNNLCVYSNEVDIKLLMKRFDIHKNYCLNFSDFFDMVVPYEKEYRNMVENRAPNTFCQNSNSDFFMYTTKLSFKDLFNGLINAENKLSFIKRNFTTLRLKLKEIFNLIDTLNLGYFKIEDLNFYLTKNNLFTNKKDEQLLFNRFDKNRDGKIDYCEFEEEILPIC